MQQNLYNQKIEELKYYKNVNNKISSKYIIFLNSKAKLLKHLIMFNNTFYYSWFCHGHTSAIKTFDLKYLAGHQTAVSDKKKPISYLHFKMKISYI